MRILNYIKNNLSQKRFRSFLCILGIAFSLTSTIVMALMTDYYSTISTGFFTPFSGFDQTLERGTNYVQLMPTGSNIGLTIEEELNAHFGVTSIPMLIIPNSEDLLSFYNNYFLGVPISQQPTLLDKVRLQTGRWPQTPNEILVGDKHANLTSLNAFNQTFTVCGVLRQQFSYFDRIVLFDYQTLANLTGRQGRATVIFVPKSIEEDPAAIVAFENDFSGVEILTTADLDELRGEIGGFMDNMVNVLGVFTSASSIVFVFSVELLNIFSRKKDFEILQILGMKQSALFATVLLESAILLGIGVIIGLPLAFLSYSGLFGILVTTTDPSATFFPSALKGVQRISDPFPFEIFGRFTLLISIANVAFAFIIAALGLHKFNISKLKQKY